ncbi:MAG: hypothetical protein IJ048_11645 [Clostridia bacterium]|nr:hypothetical protein [Clostridia bacterium]
MTTAGVGTRRAAHSAPQAKAQPRMARMNRILLRVALALVAASLFLYVNRMAAIASGAKTISRLRTQIAAEESRRQQLEIALAERRNLEMIGYEAVSRLGMVRPGSWSVRVVTLPGEAASGDSQTVYDTAGDAATP